MILAKIDQRDVLEPSAPIRAEIDEAYLKDLADSINQIGLLQPPYAVRRGDKYEVIAGHRRLLATRMLGWPNIDLYIADADDDSTVLAGRLHENIIRRDISPVEEAAFYAELMEKYQDVDEVCRMVKRSRAVVEGRLVLLTSDQDVLMALNRGEINLAVAAELNQETDTRKRKWFLEFAIVDGATARTVSSWRRSYTNLSLDGVDLSAKPEVTPDGKEPVVHAPPCYLCGDTRDQPNMRWVPIHVSCQDVAKRLGWTIQPDKE